MGRSDGRQTARESGDSEVEAPRPRQPGYVARLRLEREKLGARARAVYPWVLRIQMAAFCALCLYASRHRGAHDVHIDYGALAVTYTAASLLMTVVILVIRRRSTLPRFERVATWASKGSLIVYIVSMVALLVATHADAMPTNAATVSLLIGTGLWGIHAGVAGVIARPAGRAAEAEGVGDVFD